MYYKSLNIFVQIYLNKWLLVNLFNPLDSKQGFLDCIGSLNKFFFCKLDVYIAEGEKEDFWYNLHADVGH